jgi:hypothetical protein
MGENRGGGENIKVWGVSQLTKPLPNCMNGIDQNVMTKLRFVDDQINLPNCVSAFDQIANRMKPGC